MKLNLLHKVSILLIISVLLLFCTASILMYRNSNAFMKNSVQNECIYLKYSIEVSGPEIFDFPLDEASSSRITLSDKDGTVLYDSFQDADTMENHGNRPEFIQAQKEGSWETVRYSETLSRQTFYYALLLNNHMVLRVSQTSGSVLLLMLAGFLVVMILLFLLLAFLMYHLQRREVEMVRREFSANVSHELKTPLMSISGYAEIMENGMVQEKDIPEFAGRIHHEAQRLTNLVNDIIQLSKLDEGAENMPFENIDIFELTQNVKKDLAIQAAKKKISVSLSGTCAFIYGNCQILYEMFFNLMDNAIRYTGPEGHVHVEISPSSHTVSWCITDNGIGIAEGDQERIFERFYRVDKSHSRATGGTGLGLSIVKHGAALHEAKLHLCSHLGEGTSITLVFPVSPRRTR